MRKKNTKIIVRKRNIIVFIATKSSKDHQVKTGWYVVNVICGHMKIILVIKVHLEDFCGNCAINKF